MAAKNTTTAATTPAAGATAPAASEAKWATFKGHGSPDAFWSFGMDRKGPRAEGTLHQVTPQQRTSGVMGGVATKFWAVPVAPAATEAPAAEAKPAKAAKAPAKKATTEAPAAAEKPAKKAPLWTKGDVDAEGFTVVWVHGYYALLKKPAGEGAKGFQWVAAMADGARLDGTSVGDAEAKARAYGKEHGLVRGGK